jgi:TetR/AcrR family transcriptional regulator, cholesterol catabolism regulator
MKRTRSSGSASRREEIVIAAAKTFAAKGYLATTLDEIAREIGVSKPALYYHIKNKEEILREIIGRIMEPMEEVARVGKSDLSPRERVETMIRMLVKFAVERKEITLIALEQSRILPKRSQDALRRRQKEVEKVLQETLREGKQQGVFAVYDVKMASFAILAVSNWIYRWYQPGGTLTAKVISDQFIDLLENGFLKKKA